MNYVELFKNDFITNYTSGSMNLAQIIGTLVVTGLLAGYIFVIYRLITKKTFYSKNFNISVAAISVITAAIILAVQTSIVISLGMVGALSIVRFRTAIKEPMDLCFLFWSIAVGICCGAHMVDVAAILSVVLTVLVIILDRLPVGRAPMILIVNLTDGKKEPELMKVINEFSGYKKVKSRNLTGGRCNLIIEIRIKQDYEMTQRISELEGVEKVSLVSHDGEVTF